MDTKFEPFFLDHTEGDLPARTNVWENITVNNIHDGVLWGGLSLFTILP
jgi:hypothetical protein